MILNIENELMVRKERLELSHLSVLEPKSSASTNSATFAHMIEIADVYGLLSKALEVNGRLSLAAQRPLNHLHL